MAQTFWQRSIEEYNELTKHINPSLKEYVEKVVFPKYAKNDKAHGIIHIIEAIRRSFILNESMNLNLNNEMIYAIASYHDLGKYIDSDNHHLIAGTQFAEDENMHQFFSPAERDVIKQAIEDHRSSKEDSPRSNYGKLISSADRNTRIEMVFIRSFFVAKAKMPEENIEDYLDYTIKRLSKRYSLENPENMFYEDEEYSTFLQQMRNLLKDAEAFKILYCQINHITDRTSKVVDNEGETEYSL